MMDKETTCVVTGMVGSVSIGALIGTALNKTVANKCTPLETVGVTVGAMALAFAAGSVFQKEFYGYCDKTFGTDIRKLIDW